MPQIVADVEKYVSSCPYSDAHDPNMSCVKLKVVVHFLKILFQCFHMEFVFFALIVATMYHLGVTAH